MSEKISGWIGLLAGLAIGASIGGLIIYVILTREARTTVKTFAYEGE